MGFWTQDREIHAGHMGDDEHRARVRAYSDGNGIYSLEFRAAGVAASYSLWADEAGLEAIRDACNTTLVRAQIERERADALAAQERLVEERVGAAAA